MRNRCLNRVIIIGNVGSEPEFASTRKGTPVCPFSVATNRFWLPRGTFQKREETHWHQVVTFKLTEICRQILTKGTKQFVLGRIKSRKLTNRQGEVYRKTEILASELIALDKRKNLPAEAPLSLKIRSEKLIKRNEKR